MRNNTCIAVGIFLLIGLAFSPMAAAEPDPPEEPTLDPSSDEDAPGEQGPCIYIVVDPDPGDPGFGVYQDCVTELPPG